jgi:two-component system response regulator MprA
MMELFLTHPRQIFPREVILNRVWGYEYMGDTNVIDVHIRHLREKLGDEERTLIRSVRGVGYGLEPPDDLG